MIADEMKAAIRRHRAGELSREQLQQALAQLEERGEVEEQAAKPKRKRSPASK